MSPDPELPRGFGTPWDGTAQGSAVPHNLLRVMTKTEHRIADDRNVEGIEVLKVVDVHLIVE